MSHARDIATAVARQLQANGFIGVFAGGCVRDRGKEPKDFDVATNATPDQIKRVFGGDHCLPVGEQFGVIVVVREKVQIEVATLRNDGQFGDGRRPDGVVFLTDNDPMVALRGDAARRDLTVNAMFEDPITGRIFDFFGGEDDLRARILRAVGDPGERFREDRLRMLRVARFAAKLGFSVDRKLEAALKRHANTLEPGRIVAWERIGNELQGTLTSKDPVTGLKLLINVGLMKEIIPELLELRGFRGFQDPFWHPEGFALTHTLKVVNVAATEEGFAEFLAQCDDEFIREGIRASLASFPLRLALLLHDIAKARTQAWGIAPRSTWLRRILPWRIKVSNHGHAEMGVGMSDKICRRLKYSNDVNDRVQAIVGMHMKMHHFDDPQISRKKLVQLMARKEIFDLIVMEHCDVFGTGRMLQQRRASSLLGFYLRLMGEMRNDPVLSRRPGAKSIVTGDHIIKRGFRPGPMFRVIKDAALEAQIAGSFADEASGLAWLDARVEEFRAMESKVS